jgi:ABC-type transport system involved in multi-copper enzyme maturation permease subunit
LAGQIERGSIYHLLSRPVARWTLVVGKTLEMVLGAGVVALAGWLGTFVGTVTTPLPQAVPLGSYFLIALLAWALFAALGAGAMVISSWGSNTGRVVGIGSAWTLVAFVLDVLPAITESPLGLFNPWRHYDPQAVVATGALSALGVTVLLAWIIGATMLACVVWARRDLA